MKKLILLKLGGSVITDKTKPGSLKPGIIKNLAAQIALALKTDKDLRLVIGNGAGSYGHYPAVRYKMEEGIGNEKQKEGFCIVQDAVGRLNRIIVGELLAAGVRAVSVQPSSVIIAGNNKINRFFTDSITKLLFAGFVPVIYGDIIIDEKNGSSIFSSEQLLAETAIRLLKKGFPVKKIIHTGITDGVLDKNGKKIPLIRKKEWSVWKNVFYKPEGYDTTGGMLHKVRVSLKLAEKGVETLIINGIKKSDILFQALIGKEVEGTSIEL